MKKVPGTIMCLVVIVAVMSCKQPNNTVETKPDGKGKDLLTGDNLVGSTLIAALEKVTGGKGTPSITISGAREETGGEYVVEFEDVGQKIKIVAVYNNGRIEYTMPNAVPAPTMTVQLTESITDNDGLYVGETLTIQPTVDNVAGTSIGQGYNYSWKADDTAIGGQTGATLEVTNYYAGKTITGTAALKRHPGVTAAGTSTQVKEPIKTCDSPNGTLHLTGEECCEGEDCECEKNVAGVRSSNGIAITNRANIEDISGVVTKINTVLGNLSDSRTATLKKNVKEITIIAGDGVSYDFATKTITIGADAVAGDIRATFLDYLDEDGIIAMKQLLPKYNRAMQMRDNRIASRSVRQRMG
jgi:hypothetical protein